MENYILYMENIVSYTEYILLFTENTFQNMIHTLSGSNIINNIKICII